MAMVKITISRDGFESNNPAYRIDCDQHGPVEKGYGKNIIHRADDHNKVAHNGKAFVDIPDELIPRRG